MIAETGHFALILALALALVQTVMPFLGAQWNDNRLMATGRPAAQGQFVLVLISFLALSAAFITSDFSVATVAANSHTDKPLIYKIAGVWGNHEGSMLLWVLILSLFGGAVATFGNNLPDTLKARVLSVQGSISVAFLLFMLLSSNPFERLFPAPFDGNGLNPILQDPALAFHPPFLYAGYVGFSMAFSFAVAALLEGRVDPAWARWVRPWTLAAWCSLTLGIAMGSWWAYYELGWGGWWFWDPVENASFMPWLLGTALLHSAIVVEKRGALKSWTILLAIFAFSLSLVGTFLVRSGVLTSVHAFAVDPERGLIILGILVVFIGGSLGLYAWRAPALKGGGLFAPISREGALIVNNLILATGALTVFVGTLYPLLLDALDGPKISVGPGFFNMTFVPLMVPLLFLVPFGPMLSWKRADLAAAAQRLSVAAGVAVFTLALFFYLRSDGPWMAPFAMALAVWIIMGAVSEISWRIRLFRGPLRDAWRRARHLPRSAWGSAIAHAGVGVMVAGIVGISAWREEVVTALPVGESFNIAHYEVRFDGVKTYQGPNFTAQTGQVTVFTPDGEQVAVMFPEKRIYTVSKMPTTEAAIRTRWVEDLYIVLGDEDDTGSWVMRAYVNPIVPWIWIGAVIMTFGGMVSLTDRRLRVGAPKAAKKKSDGQSQKAEALP
ncbi:MAG: heme lyase CcmF/NrfE family subunit [Parvibaculaceae bacterium]|nr:heme lyase CcmF/NrfE family subunit [Parvibaculaceae bacterium]